MKKGIIIICAIILFTAGSACAEITVYPNDRSGWEKAVGIYEEEFFTDAILNPGVSVVSEYPGYVDTTKGVWWDRLVCPYWGKTTTIWQFDTPIIGFGGNWNPGVPGGPGANIEVAINGSWISVGEISRYYTGQFWGFVSTEPFTAVRLSPGSYCYPPGGAWCETYELDNMVYSYAGRILPDKAKELAIDVIGKDYGYDLPGWWPEKIKGFTKYYVNDDRIVELLKPKQIESLDCSGLSFWAYNRAYYDDKKIFAGKKWETEEGDWENRPLYWYGANMQYTANVDKINKEELKPGDLVFFNVTYKENGKVKWCTPTKCDNIIDHVAMYIGSYEGEEHAIVHAHAGKDDIDNAGKISVSTVNGLITYYSEKTGRKESVIVYFGRARDAKKPEFKAIVESPVDLVVIDPDGEIITKEIGESPTMEYIVYDINGDGELDDIIASPERKTGDYLITVVPEPDASPADTYSLEVTVNGETIVLAEDVPISDIPSQPYQIQSTETEIKVAPIANANGPYEGNEGSPITFDASGSYDPDGSIVLYEWDFDGDGIYDLSSTSSQATFTFGDDYTGVITLRVTDNDGFIAIDTAEVTVNNVAPIVEAGTGQEAYAGDIVNFSGSFSDPGWLDTHTGEWDFGDDTTQVGTLIEENDPPDATGQVAGSHIYYEKGTYIVTLTVKDDDGGAREDTLEVVVKPIPAIIDCDPDTLNLKSKGKWITCYIELPDGPQGQKWDVWEIDGSTILLNGVVPVYLGRQGWAKAESNESNIMDHDKDGELERMVKFERSLVQEILAPGENVELTLTGKVFYNQGLADFEGKDYIRVIDKGNGNNGNVNPQGENRSKK